MAGFSDEEMRIGLEGGWKCEFCAAAAADLTKGMVRAELFSRIRM